MPPIAYPLLRLIGHQRIINRGKVKLLHKLVRPSAKRGHRFTTDFFGFRYSGDVANWIDWNVYFTGAFARNELELLADVAHVIRHARGFVHYVDVGANVGHHSLFMSAHADQLSAFEPFPRVAREIERKIEENGLTNLRMFPVALGDADGEAEISLLDEANLGTATLVENRFGDDGRIPIGTTPVRAGAALFDREGLPRIDILKVDVEGFEAAVFRGLRERILSDRPVILTELSGDDRSGFGSADAFRAALYPDHTLHSVGGGLSGSYRLLPFDVEAGEVLCWPNELGPIERA